MSQIVNGEDGNNGALIPSWHPSGLSYVAVKRDIPGSAIIVYEESWDGPPTRIVKAYVSQGDAPAITKLLHAEEQAAGRPTDFPIGIIQKPVATPGVLCRPDGSLKVYLPTGKKDGYCGYGYEILPNVCPPWTPTGTWPLTVSATDDQARRMATAAQQAADAASAVAADAKSVAQDVKKNVKPVAAPIQDVLQIVSDDLAERGPDGKPNGRLRHALWPILVSMVGDVIYGMLEDAHSALINVIKQGGKVIGS